MNILWLNRYDILSPKAGGAERFDTEMIERLVRDGHKVTIFSSKSAKKLQNQENHNNINIIRKGNLLSVLWHAYRFYLQNKNTINCVIDEYHAFPFFSKFYVEKCKRINLIHEVAGPIWFYEMFFPINFIGFLFEKFVLKFIYKDENFVTISESTKRCLIDSGISKMNIEIVPMGIKFIDKISANELSKKVEKTKHFQILYFGGLRKLKNVEDQIFAISALKKEFSDIKLLLLGNNNSKYAKYLEKLVYKEGLENNVVFTGFITEDDLIALVKESWLTLSTSVREGWGLYISESNLFGLPGVVYNSDGIRDAVVNGKNGLITKHNTPVSMAESIRELILNKKLYNELVEGSKMYAANMTWDKTYEKFINITKLYATK
jgi:glycosyltransferase involved in cell wall biosynthesis